MKATMKYALPLAAAILLAGCGGSDSKEDTTNDTGNAGNTNTGNTGNTNTPAVVQSFSAKAQWAITPAKGSTTCFDFDTNKDVACEGTAWDIKASLGTEQKASVQFYTNSGPLTTGKGGALGDTFNFTWAELAALPDTTKMPDGNPLLGPMFVTDNMSNAFTDSGSYGAFQYSHQKILSKYSVYLVTTDNTAGYDASSENIYAVQLVDYYGGDTGSKSGYPKIRYVKLSELGTEGAVKEVQVNASAGWAYLDLTTGQTTAKDGSWHLGFSRYNIVTNSGNTGGGAVGSFEAQKAAGFYDANGAVIEASLTDDALIAAAKNLLTTATDWKTPATASKWSKDTLKSALNPAYKAIVMQTTPGNMKMNLDYGFYSYYVGIEGHADHSFGANPENGVLLRSGDGTSYARVHLSSIVDGLYTFDFDVAPAVAK